jgi:hypothetical protein
MQKLDLKKTLKDLYQPSAKAVGQVVVPRLNFLMVDGEGDPNTSPAYAQTIEALYAVSYTLKFQIKKGPQAIDYAVMPLEGLWWADDMDAFLTGDKARWHWTMMIMQPDCVSREQALEAIAEVVRKKALPALRLLRWEAFEEGLCAQTLHIGPFDQEGPTIERVHAFIRARGQLAGKHHEIYLSDIRRAEPAKWKTIVRQPMA